MCGIFGLITSEKTTLTAGQHRALTDTLFTLSETRGKDSSGFAFRSTKALTVYKKSLPAHRLIQSSEYKKVIDGLLSSSLSGSVMIGHSRMETDGTFNDSDNNQPVVRDDIALVHNGIIVNHQELWRRHKLRQRFQVDTEVLNALLRLELGKHSPTQAVANTFQEIEGSASVAILGADIPGLLLATNKGSLYVALSVSDGWLLFASEFSILWQALQKHLPEVPKTVIEQLQAGSGLFVEPNGLTLTPFSLQTKTDKKLTKTTKALPLTIASPNEDDPGETEIAKRNQRSLLREVIEKTFAENKAHIDKLRRCTKCILPETMPFITFNSKGVCSYCQNYKPKTLKPIEELEQALEPYRGKGGIADCIVPFSGGRDSSYGLYYAKEVLGLKPLAYSYDWGMLTDLGRRNQARMTGALGVEHLLISADIHKKRKNIQKNVRAWLRRPNLGTIPLFMAGDKQYFYYANKLREQAGLDLILYLENSLEKTDFKSGFCGIKPVFGINHGYNLGLVKKLKMAGFYAKEFLLNPSFINTSLFDTISAFFSSYFIPHKYLFLFDYIPWKEGDIDKILIEQFNWETSPDTKTTWRIGDGTAAFYNYIYYTAAGFTENDTFRSNQVREGSLTREEALTIASQDNRPRFESLLWYCNTIDLDLEKALSAIHGMAKKYPTS